MRGSGENEETGTKHTGGLKKTKHNQKKPPKKLRLRSEEEEPPSPGGKGKKKSFRSSVSCHGIIRWMISQQFTHQLKVSNVFSNPSSDSNTVSPRNVKPPRR